MLKPTEYWKTKGVRKPGKSSFNPSPYYWAESTVNKILTSREYMGDLVNFKTYSKSFKNKRRYENPEENHIVFPGAHEPIIDQQMWEMVQRIRKGTKRRQPKTIEKHMFAGVLYCADCGRRLHFNVNHPSTHIKFFSCSNYRGNRGTCSSTHYIRADALEEVMLLELRRMTQYLRDKEEDFVELLMAKTVEDAKKESKYRQQELGAMLTRSKDLDVLFSKTYEDNANGKLSDERFMMLTKRFDEEQAELKKKISTYQAEIDAEEKHEQCAASFLETVRKYTDIQELSPMLINDLVEKIVVHHAQGEGVNRSQELEIHYNFVGILDIPDVVAVPASVTIDTRRGVAVEYITRKAG